MYDAVTVADRINPLGGPEAPLASRALTAAFGPSLMPRAGWHQGMATGLSVLAAQVVGRSVNNAIDRLVPGSHRLSVRLATLRTGRCHRGPRCDRTTVRAVRTGAGWRTSACRERSGSSCRGRLPAARVRTSA